MNQFLKDLFIDALNQLFGWEKPRAGKLILTRHAVMNMHEHQLTEATLENAFRFGEEIPRGDTIQITHHYASYSVNLWYKVIYTPYRYNMPSEKRFLVITCWKEVKYA